MNRLCTCTGGAGVVVLGSFGLVALLASTSSGLGPATGACCFNDGSCSVETQTSCNQMGGEYSGDGTNCNPNLCLVQGACCFLNENDPKNPDDDFGDCTVTDQVDCETNLLGTYLGDLTDCSECSQNNCTKADSACQEPNIGQFPGGTILTAGDTYDNFIPEVTGPITSVCFWGAYIGDDPDGMLNGVDCDDDVTGDTVTITFYDNESSIPPFPADPNSDGNPDPIWTVNVSTGGGTLDTRATGVDFQLGGFGGLPVSEYEYVAENLAGSPTFNAGTCYWIRVENTVTSANPSCTFFWEVSPEVILDPTGDGDDFSQGGVDPGDGTTQFFPNDFDMAWCIDLDLASLADDQTTDGGCFQEINAACIQDVPDGQGACVILGTPQGDQCAIFTEANCNNAGGEWTEGEDCLRECNTLAYVNPLAGNTPYPGCEDTGCCTLVCDGDDSNPDIEPAPFCCQIGWDQLCADIAVFDHGCAAVPLCQPAENCQSFQAGLAFFAATDSSGANGDQFVPADDFTPAVSDTITSLCWYGHYDPGDSGITPGTETNDFTVTFYADADGLPGAPIKTYAQADLDTAALTVAGTNTFFGTFPVNEYNVGDLSLTAAGGVDVTGGDCYWVSIENNVGGDGSVDDPASWLWHAAVVNSSDPNGEFYAGNGRLADDAADENGNVSGDYDVTELIGGADLAFCIDIELSDPACGLSTLYNPGPERTVEFDSSDSGQFGVFFLGWSSGQLCSPDCPNDTFPNRRTVQPFSVGGPAPNDFRVRQIFVDGFEPAAGELNEEMNYAIYSRSGEARPDENDLLYTASIPFGAAITGLTHPESQGVGSGVGSGGALHAIHTDFNLPAGDYWLTIWASNSSNLAEGGGQTTASNFAWFTNAERNLDLTCPAEPWPDPTPEDEADTSIIGCNDLDPMYPPDSYLWRARFVPDGNAGDPNPGDGYGFGSYSLDPTTTLRPNPAFDPPTDPADLMSAAFMVRGGPGVGECGDAVVDPGEDCDDGNDVGGDGCSAICKDEGGGGTCPQDCVGMDNFIGIDEFLAVLATWGQIGAPCDFAGAPGVGIDEFLAVLGLFGGPCP